MASVVEVATVLLLLFSLSVPKKLHLFFLLVDDWRWMNAGYHCDTPMKEVATPNFNSLVREGL